MEQTIPSKANFTIARAKLPKDGGLAVSYHVEIVNGQEVYNNEYEVRCEMAVHPDLKKLFEELKPIVAEIFHQDVMTKLVKDKDFKATAKQKEIIEKMHHKMIDNIMPRSISISGSEDKRAVIITSQMRTDSGMETCINTPRIAFDKDMFGVELELEELITSIEDEVYSYLFDGKQAQLELFGE